jgi:hypothetical protein
MINLLLFPLLCLASGQSLAICKELPWKFGMSPEEVSAFTECGPYKSFSNGDLETYNGVFDGKQENIQFFFEERKLRRIGIYIYEGRDLNVAAKKWAALYATMTRHFGTVETPKNVAPISGGKSAFIAKASELVKASGKTQMAPLKQPRDASVFSSLSRQDVSGELQYTVVLYFDRRS